MAYCGNALFSRLFKIFFQVVFVIAQIGFHIHAACVLGNTHQIIRKPDIFLGTPYHFTALQPFVFQRCQFAQRRGFIWVCRCAVDPCVAEFTCYNGQFMPLFPNDVCKFIQRACLHRIAGKFCFYLFKFADNFGRRRRTAVIKRVVKIQHFVHKIALKRAAVVSGIDHNHFSAPASPKETRRHLAKRGRAVYANVQKFNAVFCKQGNQRFGVPRHIGHFRRRCFSAAQFVQIVRYGKSVVKRVFVQQLRVRCKRHGMRHNVSLRNSFFQAFPLHTVSL